MMEWENEPLYYVKHRRVFKRPITRCGEKSTFITIGFPVCDAHDAVGEEGAKAIAELMNRGDMAYTLYQALMGLTGYVMANYKNCREWNQGGSMVVMQAIKWLEVCKRIDEEESSEAGGQVGGGTEGAISDPT